MSGQQSASSGTVAPSQAEPVGPQELFRRGSTGSARSPIVRRVSVNCLSIWPNLARVFTAGTCPPAAAQPRTAAQRARAGGSDSDDPDVMAGPGDAGALPRRRHARAPRQRHGAPRAPPHPAFCPRQALLHAAARLCAAATLTRGSFPYAVWPSRVRVRQVFGRWSFRTQKLLGEQKPAPRRARRGLTKPTCTETAAALGFHFHFFSAVETPLGLALPRSATTDYGCRCEIPALA